MNTNLQNGNLKNLIGQFALRLKIYENGLCYITDKNFSKIHIQEDMHDDQLHLDS